MDFWPDIFPKPTTMSPVLILQKQADLIYEKTLGYIKGVVSFDAVEDYQLGLKAFAGKGWFEAEFALVAPKLNDYKYDVMVLEQDPTGYPAYVRSELIPEGYLRVRSKAQEPFDLSASKAMWVRCDNEEKFTELLAEVLRSKRLTEVISNIIAMTAERSERMKRKKPGS